MKYKAITVFGIPNCDTVKKARTWLSDHGFEYVFHGWELVVNRKGTSWRKLSPDEQASVTSGPAARPFLLANPSLVKRPVIEWSTDKGTEVTVGFQPNQWPAR